MSFNENQRRYRDPVAYEYQHSLPVEPTLYDNDDYLFDVRPRVSSFADVSDAACFEVRNNWKAATGKEHTGAGCMGPVSGNFAALCFSEATKDRLFALAFVNEFIFIQDDYVDVAEIGDMDSAVDEFSWIDDKTPGIAKSKDEIHKLIKAVQAKVLAQLLQEKVAGGCVIDEIKKLTEEQAFTRQFDFKNGSIEEYIEFRHRDIGTYFISACTGFSVFPTISPAEVESALDITKIGYACAMLCNDYWSWEKEFEDFTGEGNWPVNAVYLFMQQHNVDAETAKEMVKIKTMELAKEYGEKAVKYVEDIPVDSAIMRWFGLLDLVVAGNALWSITCPRYHRERPQGYRGQTAGQNNVERVFPFRDAGLSFTPPPEEGSKHEPFLSSQDELPLDFLPPHVLWGSMWRGERGGTSSLPQRRFFTMEPYKYIASLPAKGLRDHLLEALNLWFGLEEGTLTKIKDVINTPHNVSLM
ncbi:terpenoid synthase [Acephala macrosclerotiorum]|nr:terpenoid synthase [Acephala macrosclerotiorum]